jgi:hypothetical protein
MIGATDYFSKIRWLRRYAEEILKWVSVATTGIPKNFNT